MAKKKKLDKVKLVKAKSRANLGHPPRAQVVPNKKRNRKRTWDDVMDDITSGYTAFPTQ